MRPVLCADECDNITEIAFAFGYTKKKIAGGNAYEITK